MKSRHIAWAQKARITSQAANAAYSLPMKILGQYQNKNEVTNKHQKMVGAVGMGSISHNKTKTMSDQNIKWDLWL